MGAAVLPLMIASTAISAYGAYRSGEAQASAASYQAAVARNNALIAQRNAAYSTQRGDILAQQKQQQTAQMLGSVRAAAGASGVDVQTGSPARLQSDVAKLGEMDVLTIRNAAAREAFGYNVQGMSYAATAGLEESAAQSAAAGGELGALSSLISGAGQIAPKWSSMFGGTGSAGPTPS